DIYDMRYIDEVGMKQVMEEALAGIDADTHLHVSFDVDMLDPSIAPGTGTKVPGGVNYREGQLIMEMIADRGRVGSLDVVEVNPYGDVGNCPAQLAVDMVEILFGKSTLRRDSPARAMPASLIIVDDFLGPADAKGLREAALGLTYPKQQGAYPGRNSVERME